MDDENQDEPPPLAKRKRPTEPTVEDVFSMGRDMMNRSTKKMGAILQEDRRFRDLFGVGATIALAAWQWLVYTSLLPENGTFQHLLWTLCFLKVHATEAPLSALCGGADPKTMRKHVWPFIFALAALEDHLVSPFEHEEECDRSTLTRLRLLATDTLGEQIGGGHRARLPYLCRWN